MYNITEFTICTRLLTSSLTCSMWELPWRSCRFRHHLSIQASRVSLSFVTQHILGQKVSTKSWMATISLSPLCEYCYYLVLSSNICVKGDKMKRGNNPIRLLLETYLDWKRSSGWLESWERLLLVTDVSTTCAEAIFRFSIYQRLLYLLTNQIAHQGFWIFNWLTLPLDSEDGFRTGCRNVSH